MRAAKKARFDKKILQELVPLNALPESHFEKLSNRILVEEVKSGHYLFRKGDRDSQSIYLLEGKVSLIDGARKVTGEVESGTDISRHPLANLQPRPLSARAARKSVIARVDSNLLDVFLSCDHTQTADVIEIDGADTGDWMTRVLQSEVFSKLPPSKIQSLLMKMRPVTFKAGDTVIRQGDEGDYFYTVHEGRCAVTRAPTPGAEEELLAELGDGDSFGEDALVSNTRRNATITMLTDGTLMRLAKQDFLELLKKQLVRHIDSKTAYAMVDEGAVWLDVRTPDEYTRGAFEDSVNIPLADLRGQLSELVFNATYILCCDTGGRSGTAAFMLSHKGLDVYVLEGGIAGMTLEQLEKAGMPVQHATASQPCAQEDTRQDAEVIDFQSGSHASDAGPEHAAAKEEGHALRVPPAAPEAYDNPGVPAGESGLLERLREEKAALLAEIGGYREAEVRFAEQLELLRAELGESGEKLGELYTQAEADAAEKQLLRDQYGALQEELDQLRQGRAGEAEVAAQRIDDLQAQLDAAREQTRAGAQATAQALESARAENETLGRALARATERADELETRVAALGDEASRQDTETAQALRDQQASVQQLQGELERLATENAQLQSELAATGARDDATAEEFGNQLRAAEERLEVQAGELAAVRESHAEKCTELDTEKQARERLNEELAAAISARDAVAAELQSRIDAAAEHAGQSGEVNAGLQHELDEAAERLVAEQARAGTLQQQIEEQTVLLESVQAELAAARDEHERTAQAGREERQVLEAELETVRNDLARLEEQSQGAAAGLASTSETIRALEQDKESLGASLREVQDRLAEQLERTAGLEREKQQAHENLSRDEAQRNAELIALNERLEAAQKAGMELQQELEALHAQHQDLQEKYAAGEASATGLQQQIADLQAAHAAETAEREGRLGEMQEALGSAREEHAALLQAVEERDTQLEALQQEISDREESRRLIEEQLESSRAQQRRLSEQIEAHEQHTRDFEQEQQQSLSKLRVELNRKYHNEKELQGQIDRLRKQLEQATLDLHEQKQGAQQDIDNLREQLHAERRARDEERADMAARQRELKEQLASIATDHEAGLGNPGDMDEARNAIRAEEQERLREMLEAQAASEDRVLKLQQELSAAHEEIAELIRQQKQMRQLDADLLQEQNRQAVGTIAQLEAQLRQLTEERDTALDEQNGLRERVDALRGEVEVARGLMTADGEGQHEDTDRLRTDLDEARKNAEIAVRLRAEAEAARDRAVRERDKLREQLSESDKPGSPAALTTAGARPAGTGAITAPARAAEKVASAGTDERRSRPGQPASAAGGINRARRAWLGLAVGVGLTALIVGVAWVLLHAGGPLTAVGPQLARIMSADGANPVAGGDAEQDAPAGESPQASGAGDTAQQEGTAPVTSADGRSGPSPAAVRSFRDRLKDGSLGPVMVELPAATYQMGSPGNSLNFDEGPRHQVTLPGFAISRHEVTFAEYDRFARATGRRLPHDEKWGRGNRPVINVSWVDANAYAEWLSRQTGKSYTLPSEAEWEYAIRAGGTSLHWWVDEPEGVYANCFDCGSDWDGTQTAPVGSFPANRFGLHDMAGNVQEWTQDCYKENYENAPRDGSAWLSPRCTQRAVRGGGYTSPLDSLRSAKRAQYDQDTRIDNIGFRVVRHF